jgi:hypothetical protein
VVDKNMKCFAEQKSFSTLSNTVVGSEFLITDNIPVCSQHNFFESRCEEVIFVLDDCCFLCDVLHKKTLPFHDVLKEPHVDKIIISSKSDIADIFFFFDGIVEKPSKIIYYLANFILFH